MQIILNLTQHVATQEQIEAGVIEPTPEHKAEIQKLLTFEEIPVEMISRARGIRNIAETYNIRYAMIGGAPYFMSTLEKWLQGSNITPLYAFSKRESVEVQTPNGIEKRSVFKHTGFVEV